MAFDPVTIGQLWRCVDLAEEALRAGDEPFGSVLVDEDGTVLAEDRNRVGGGDHTRHPEIELARYAAATMDPADRARASVLTSGEHCAMCAAAHAWVGLGDIVYIHSTEHLVAWLGEWSVPPPPVRPLSIREVAPQVRVRGPVESLLPAMYELHYRHRVGPSAPGTSGAAQVRYPQSL